MPKYLTNWGCCVIFSLIFGLKSFAQTGSPPDSSTFALVQTFDGNQFSGKVLSQDSARIVLETADFGVVTIRKAMVRSFRPFSARKVMNGKYFWFDSPQETRYFASTNGYGLHKGEGMYENVMLFFNQVTYAFSDQFSISVGMAPLFLTDGPFPVWVMPKITVPVVKEKVNVGIVGIYGHSFDPLYEEDDGSFSAVFTQFTFGSRYANTTLGFGYGLNEDGWSKRPIFSVSGMLRTGPKAALLTENHFFQADGENLSLFSFGFRIIGRRILFDLAAIMPVLEEDATLVPWIGVHVPFGSPKK